MTSKKKESKVQKITVNGNKIIQYFITFPTSGSVTKEHFAERLKRLDTHYIKLCEETHEDGQPHFHAVVQLRKPGKSKPATIKLFKKWYPDDYKRIDVKPVRSLEHSLLYFDKEDKKCYEHGELILRRNPRQNYLNKLARSYGHPTLKAFIEYQEEKSTRDHAYWLNVMKKWDYVTTNYDFDFPYEFKKIIQKFDKGYDHMNITKDDITKIYNMFKIEY